MKGQATISIVYMSVGILIALVIMYFLYSYLTSSSLETITSPFVITNFILNDFQEQTAGSCSFAISFEANQNINLGSIHAGFLLSNGDYLYPSYANYTQTTSFINAGQYLYYLKPKYVGWSGYNGTVCKFLSTAITSKSNYITGMTRIIDNKTKIFQRFTGNVEFLVNTPNTNPKDIYGDSVIGITATHNLGVIIIKGITNSTFSEQTTPGTYIYLPAGKYKIEYTNEGSSAVFLEWSSDGGILIQNYTLSVTNMTVINNGEIVIDNTLSIIPPANFNITENQTQTLVGNKVKVTADYISGYYTFYVNEAPYSSCTDTLNKTCIITESSSGTYNITASYKSSTIYGVSNKLQELFYSPLSVSLAGSYSQQTSSVTLLATTSGGYGTPSYSFYYGNGTAINGCQNISSSTCVFNQYIKGIPIQIQNSASQNFDGSNGAQVYLTPTINSSLSPIGEDRFFEGSTELYSWCEANCNTNNPDVWVNIPGGIGAGQTIAITLNESIEKTEGYTVTVSDSAGTNSATTSVNEYSKQYSDFTGHMGNSSINNDIGKVMNPGILYQYYYQGTANPSNYPNKTKIYKASVLQGTQINTIGLTYTANTNPYYTSVNGSTEDVNGQNEPYVVINYQDGYSGGQAFNSTAVPNGEDSYVAKVEGFVSVTQAGTIFYTEDDDGNMLNMSNYGITDSYENWLYNPTTYINDWTGQGATLETASPPVNSGVYRFDNVFMSWDTPSGSQFSLWSNYLVNYYSPTPYPDNIAPTITYN